MYMMLIVWEFECMYVKISVWIKIAVALWRLAEGLGKFSSNLYLVLVLIASTSFLLHKSPLEERSAPAAY